MKKIALTFCILVLVCVMVSCKPPSEGGAVLDSNFKLIMEKQPPEQGTPDDYSPQDNLSFAAYKFNRASSWESVYIGEVVAVGTKQRVKNVRQFSNGVTFSQAISVSGIKTVAEQRYVYGDTYLRRPYSTLDKNTLDATWSKSVTKLSAEEYYKDYGLIPNEIFKYNIDENNIISAEKIESENFAYKFTLSTDCVKYLKNEVRTLAGAKSDPEFLSVECTIEMDENWNVIRTTVKEKYKVSILGGITCNSSATEEFTVGKPVNIIDKNVFESFVPGGQPEYEQPKQPIDYLTLAFGNLANEGVIKLNAQIAGVEATINFDVNSGLFAFETGNTIIKSTGNYIYIQGEESVKFYSLSVVEAIYLAMKYMPSIDTSSGIAPETDKLLNEVSSMLSNEVNGDLQGESILNRILDGIDMIETDNGALITLNFALDNVIFDMEITVENDKLAYLSGSVISGENEIDVYMSPTDKTIGGDLNSATDVSALIKAAIETLNGGYLSLESNGNIVTVDLYGKVYFNSPSLDATYFDNVLKVDYSGVKFKLSAAALSPDTQMGNLENFDIIKALSLITKLPIDTQYEITNDQLLVSFVSDDITVNLIAKAENGKLDITVNVGDITLRSTDEKATINEQAQYFNFDPIAYFAKDILTDNVTFDVDVYKDDKQAFNAQIMTDAQNGGLAAKISNSYLYAYDKLYFENLNGKYSLSYESIFDALNELGIFYESEADIINQAEIPYDGIIGSIVSSGATQNAKATISQTDNILDISISESNYAINLLFDISANYLDRIKVKTDGIEAIITPDLTEKITLPNSFDEFESYDDALKSLIKPIKSVSTQKQFTLKLEDIAIQGDSPIDINGSVGVNLENELELYLDLTFIDKAQSHNVKAVFDGENVTATYNDSINVTLSKDTVLALAFMAIDLLGVELEQLETFRPTDNEKIQSDFVSDILPKDLEQSFDHLNQDVFSILDTFVLSKNDDLISLTLPNEEINAIIVYGDKVESLVISSPTVNGKVSIDYSVEPIVLPSTAFDVNSLPHLIQNLLTTVEMREFNVSGSINLSLISLINPTIKFTLKAVTHNNKPLVFLKLEVPGVLGGMLQKADSYIYYYDGVMYLKSDRYSSSSLIFANYTYKNTEYLRRTPEEFAANAIDDVFFLLPVSDLIKTTILGSMQNSESKLDLTNALKDYEYSNDSYKITVDLKAMLSNNNLDNANVTLTASERLGKKAITDVTLSTNMLGSLVRLTLNASLNEFDGEVTYGYNENDQAATDIYQMPDIIDQLSQLHPEWQ